MPLLIHPGGVSSYFSATWEGWPGKFGFYSINWAGGAEKKARRKPGLQAKESFRVI